MTEDSDRYQIVIPFASADNSSIDDVNQSVVGSDVSPSTSSIDSDLGTGQEAELEITTADRATRNAFIQVPDTIEDETTSVTL